MVLKDCQSKTPFSLTLSFTDLGKLKSFSDKQKLKKKIASIAALEQILEGVLEDKLKGNWRTAQIYIKKLSTSVMLTSCINIKHRIDAVSFVTFPPM